ncbi:50S ribosomal protein L13 [bacterium]|nr:50S ribosomal protein L13 [bacterium]
MKTFSAKKEEMQRQWFIVDATDMTLGRLATRVANVLRGKNKPIFTPHVDTGDFVIVINAEKVRLTGNKLEKKEFYRYSGYPGGLKTIPLKKVMDKKPEFLIMHAVKGMLPKNILGRKQIKKLKIFAGPNHKHQAQCPKPLSTGYHL